MVKRAIAWQLIQFTWRLLPNPTSPVLLKGKFEGGKQAIAWKLIQCDLAWRLLPKRTSAILLKGNFERGEKGVALDIP